LTYSSKNAVLVVACCIAAIAFYNHFVAPHRNCLRAAQTYETLTGTFERKNRIIAGDVRAKKKELQQLQHKSQLIGASLFDDVEAKQFFFSGIQAAAEQTNCIVNSLKFPQDRKRDSASQLSQAVEASRMALSVTGGYRNIVAIINKLQDRPERVWIDSLRIKSTASGLLQCNMTITIYVMHNKKGLADD
jgi:hypothetical protein